MIWLPLLFIISLIAIWAFTKIALTGQDLSKYDLQVEPLFSDKAASPPHFELEKQFTDIDPDFERLTKQQQLHQLRKTMDDAGLRVPTNAVVSTADSAPVEGEWVIAPGADPDKRLLYIHGGAFMMGSPQSHRIITSKFSEISGAAVFAVNYRKLPENARLDCLEDCQDAYQWLLNNGPDGEKPTDQLYIAGDSAGANMCLVLLAWIRDSQLPAPKAAVVLSPATDSTLSSPSIRKNLATDAMLQSFMGQIMRVPRTILLLTSWLNTRVRPNDPRISPIHDDLSNLPPLLIQASNSECLADDARRYTNKARAEGSDVTLQLWREMMHVWHLFEPELDEAKDAFEQIRLFLLQHR
ncbi:alpha/beta hydrolase [Amphritea sp. HPY]|uniref:alpha/beta hydrolase n=1 Tax=Amphritea sp. HPY TaxID=3421652 RepID=UPI003D7DE203